MGILTRLIDLRQVCTELIANLRAAHPTREVVFYDKDPSQVGYFSIASIGRSVSLGNGVPAAPLQYSVRPDLSQKFGAFSVGIWYQYGQYVPGDGYGHSAGLKLQYKISKAIKVWASGTWQDDVDAQRNAQVSNTLALGARYTF